MTNPVLSAIPTVTVGGLPIAAVNRAEAAALMIRLADEHQRGTRPLYLTSANGEVIARTRTDETLRAAFLSADQILADGQPMVWASRLRCRRPLPERVATTDLFHDIAQLAEMTGHSIYMFGATAEENARAVATVRRLYPKLTISGASHGYLKGEELDRKLQEIDRLAPDIMFLAMGVPHEQTFVAQHADKLPNVGMIKTSGGLFNFLSGKNRRAPVALQRLGLEWLYRTMLEPQRLLWRYLVTNPVAIYQMLRFSE
jgi:N-acetylglucosaminyldiphosphoundecaprenol N-acetyl-beta-D-mannosaminyltransferase